MSNQEYLKKEKYLRIKDLKKRKMLFWEALEECTEQKNKDIIIKRIKEVDKELNELICSVTL
jgi:hypothetical protein